MAISITNKDTLKQIFDKVSRVYYFASSNTALGSQTQALEFPVLEDGVSFNTGDPDKSEVKLTDGTTWTSKVKQGESDISFQVSSSISIFISMTSSVSNSFDSYSIVTPVPPSA